MSASALIQIVYTRKGRFNKKIAVFNNQEDLDKWRRRSNSRVVSVVSVMNVSEGSQRHVKDILKGGGVD